MHTGFQFNERGGLTPIVQTFPECTAHLIRKRFHDVGPYLVFPGLDVDFRWHAGLQTFCVFEAGLFVIKCGSGNEVGHLPLRDP